MYISQFYFISVTYFSSHSFSRMLFNRECVSLAYEIVTFQKLYYSQKCIDACERTFCHVRDVTDVEALES